MLSLLCQFFVMYIKKRIRKYIEMKVLEIRKIVH